MTSALKLPENPTPEQFKKAEPLILKRILKEYYTDGNIRVVDYRRVSPGKYTGEFKDGKKRFSFTIDNPRDNVNYKAINPNEID